LSTRPCYFVVALDHTGREQPSLYWEELPRTPIRRMTYVLRLDECFCGSRIRAPCRVCAGGLPRAGEARGEFGVKLQSGDQGRVWSINTAQPASAGSAKDNALPRVGLRWFGRLWPNRSLPLYILWDEQFGG